MAAAMSSVTTVAMAASLFSLLLLPLAPMPISSAPYAKEVARSIIKESANDYMEQKAQQGITNLLSGQRKDGGQQKGSAAADGFGALLLDISIGTTPQTLSVVMDITDELLWAQCEPCPSCTPGPRRRPEARTFLPKNSDSFREVGCASETCQRAIPGGEHHCAGGGRDRCTYSDTFGDSSTSGFLATDTFSFGTAAVPGMVFGCSGDIRVTTMVGGASGFAGFSRAPLSLVSRLNISRFSYFIAPHEDAADGKSYVSWSTGSADDLEFASPRPRGRR